MERFICFYGLQTKAWLKKKICWIQLLAMLLLTWMFAQVHLPDQQNVRIGIGNYDLQTTAEITELLQRKDSRYEFCLYEDEDLLRRDVKEGKLECGFVFAPDFDLKYQKRDFENSVLYLATPFTTKGLAAQETFYAAFLQMYGKDLLLDRQESIFGTDDPKVAKMLSELYDDYLKSDEIFHTQILFVEGEQPESENHTTLPLHGMIGILIFMIIFLAGMGMTGMEDLRFLSNMEIQNRRLFQVSRMLSAATPAGILGLTIVCTCTESRGLVPEIVHMLGLILVSVMEVLFLFRLQRNQELGKASLLAFIVIQIMVCPVFFHISDYIPALSKLRFLFPLGYYL